MNINSEHQSDLSHTLRTHIEAMAQAQPPLHASDSAQRRLMERVRAGSTASRARAPRLLAMAASACAVLALAVAVFLGDMAGTGGTAFAQVQRHFRDFDVMRMEIVQSMSGAVIQQSEVTVARSGVVRVDVGDQLSVIVDPPRGRGVSLLHQPRQAVPFTFERGEAVQGTEALEWMEALQEFQGLAEPLPGTRRIAGREAVGWALELDGQYTELWATRDGLPLAMQSGPDGAMQLQFRFDFAPEVPAAHLSTEVPTGYAAVAGE